MKRNGAVHLQAVQRIAADCQCRHWCASAGGCHI